VRRFELVRVEDADGIGHQVVTGVRRTPRLIGDRAAGVAVVVADDEPAIGWRITRVAERLGTEFDAVRFDHPLTHARLLLSPSDFTSNSLEVVHLELRRQAPGAAGIEPIVELSGPEPGRCHHEPVTLAAGRNRDDGRTFGAGDAAAAGGASP
jgi:hypothetical protein